MISVRRFWPSSFRHFFWADIISLKAMAKPVFRLRHPLVRFVRCRTVAKVLSIGFDVRMGLVPRQHSTGGKQRLGATTKMGERSLRRLLIIGANSLDLAKNVFQAHGAGTDRSVVFRRKLSRAQLLKFLDEHPFCVVAMEAGQKTPRPVLVEASCAGLRAMCRQRHAPGTHSSPGRARQ